MAERILSSLDLGDWAEHYAADRGFYGHFKDEVYPLFIRLLADLPVKARVLDVGAGPGNLAREFHRANPDHQLDWVLLDASAELLSIARKRLAGRSVTAINRSFNADDWAAEIGRVDAIVSNNALFHLKPEGIGGFYAGCCGVLRPGGFLLNQQSFAWTASVPPHDGAFPGPLRSRLQQALPSRETLSEEAEEALAREHRDARQRHQEAIRNARDSGVAIGDGYPPYQFVTVERHVNAMREAGLAAGTVWRKLEFAVICGLKPKDPSGAGL